MVMKKILILSLIFTSIYNIYKITTFNNKTENNPYRSRQHLFKTSDNTKTGVTKKITQKKIVLTQLITETKIKDTPNQLNFINKTVPNKAKILSQSELISQVKQIHDMQWTSLYVIPTIMGEELISLETFNKYLKIKKDYKKKQENSEDLFNNYLENKYGYAEVMDEELDWNNFKEDLHSSFLSKIQSIFEPEAYDSYQNILNKYISDTENRDMKIANVEYTIDWSPI
jgi:uncharacterized protein YxeA